jgi:polar amino acid transport system ATP-binding protein
LIKVVDLHKKFGNLHVLKGITQHVESGEVVVVIGPSGSGKSTFLRCLNRLEEATSGEVYIEGARVTDDQASLRAIREEITWSFSGSTCSRI